MPQTPWDSLPPAQRAALEAELRARGIDPASVRGVSIDVARDADSASSPMPPPAAGARPERIEVTIDGRTQVFTSADQIPDDVRALLHRVRAEDGKPAGEFTIVQTTRLVSQERAIQQILPALTTLVRSGHSIEAIKLVRERTGMGLAEAHAVVEDLRAALNAVPSRKRLGCLPVLLVGACAALGAGAWMVRELAVLGELR